MPRIAVDAMGGDHAPREVVLGAVDAAEAGHDIVLVGDRSRIELVLGETGADVAIADASEVIEMGADAASAIRERKDASISVAARLVSSGEAAALVSAGSTGAAMAAASFLIGRIDGVSRPAIASMFPGGKIVLDSGANLSCRPEHLVQFAVMGAALAATKLGIERPRVGLLNIGEEAGKGRDLEREAYPLLAEVPSIEFVGNVEGRDVGSDRVDVIVSDGFTGNVLLKTAEGAAKLLLGLVVETLSGPELADKMAAIVPALGDVRHRLDPESYGGAHLLGTMGVVVIAHGSSSRRAVANAIGMASDEAAHGLVERITRDIGAVHSLAGA